MRLDKEKSVKRSINKALAQRMHSEIVQTMATISMRTGLLRRSIDESNEEAFAEVKQLETLSKEAVREIRYFLFVLAPGILESAGFVQTVKEWGQLFEKKSNCQILVNFEDSFMAPTDINWSYEIFSLVEAICTKVTSQGGQEIKLIFASEKENEISVRLIFDASLEVQEFAEEVKHFLGKIAIDDGDKGKSIWEIRLPSSPQH